MCYPLLKLTSHLTEAMCRRAHTSHQLNASILRSHSCLLTFALLENHKRFCYILCKFISVHVIMWFNTFLRSDGGLKCDYLSVRAIIVEFTLIFLNACFYNLLKNSALNIQHCLMPKAAMHCSCADPSNTYVYYHFCLRSSSNMKMSCFSIFSSNLQRKTIGLNCIST